MSSTNTIDPQNLCLGNATIIDPFFLTFKHKPSSHDTTTQL